MTTGDPVRIGFFSTGTDSVHTTAVVLLVPGTSTVYPFQPTDTLIIDSLGCNADSLNEVYLLAVPGGTVVSTVLNSANLLAVMGGTNVPSLWRDAGITEALSSVVGVIPSFGTTGPLFPTNQISVFGTGHVIHSPAYAQGWTAPGTPIV